MFANWSQNALHFLERNCCHKFEALLLQRMSQWGDKYLVCQRSYSPVPPNNWLKTSLRFSPDKGGDLVQWTANNYSSVYKRKNTWAILIYRNILSKSCYKLLTRSKDFYIPRKYVKNTIVRKNIPTFNIYHFEYCQEVTWGLKTLKGISISYPLAALFGRSVIRCCQ